MAAPNFYLREDGGRFDATQLIGSDGALIGRQKMVHIAQARQFYEQDCYTPSDDGFQVFDTPHGRIGVVVRFDRHYPESIRSTVGAITEYSAEAASTTLRHLLSTVRQVDLPDQDSRWPPRNTWGSTTWTAARPLTALPPSWASVRCISAAFSVRSTERGSRSISAAFASKKQSSCRKNSLQGATVCAARSAVCACKSPQIVIKYPYKVRLPIPFLQTLTRHRSCYDEEGSGGYRL